MNIREVHDDTKEVSAKVIFKPTGHSATAIQIMEKGLLKEHITKIPALLTCIKGEALYQDEKGREAKLGPGDFHNIEPMVKTLGEGYYKVPVTSCTVDIFIPCWFCHFFCIRQATIKGTQRFK